MRQGVCEETRTSVLGFGCGSVLGRVGRRASLRAMNTAWDQGITLFDTARSYGQGEAEAVLGEFLRGKREQAIVSTKFGIAPGRQSALARCAVPMARLAIHIPGVRSLIRRGGGRGTVFGQFTVAGLRESLEVSLRQLRTDRVDLLFLHEATASAIYQEDLMAELSAQIRAGKVLRAGICGSAEVIAACIADGPATLTAMQFGVKLLDPVVARVTKEKSPGMLLIANHPFGGKRRVARLKTALAAMSADSSVPVDLREKLSGGEWQMVIEALFGLVLTGSGTHALVFSMMRPDHLRANALAVENNRFSGADLALIRERLLNL
jgi:aryl-alcohol dehydrogenase-like predicted oxidoreductase